MLTELSLVPHYRSSTPVFDILFSAVIFGIAACLILWNRIYQRKWPQIWARKWPQVAGRFDEGEVITMRKGSSGDISGYQVWIGYEYVCQGEQGGLYTLPFSGEYKTAEEAEECLKLVAKRNVMVRVSPNRPGRSAILDRDVAPLLDIGLPLEH